MTQIIQKYPFIDALRGYTILSEEDGTTENGYLWQDFPSHIVIFLAVSEKHMDIGFPVDGFVGRAGIFRRIEALDVRL